MTAFAPSQIPPNVTTVEALSIWASQILQNVNFGTTIVEAPNGSALPVASSTPFPIRSSDFTGTRVIARLSIPINNDYGTGDIWEAAQQLSTNPIPAEYTM